MLANKFVLMSAAALALGMAAAQGVSAQSGASDTDKAVQDYKAALDAAYMPGYWNGSFEELDASGKVIDSNTTPSCIAADDQQSFSSTMVEAVAMIRNTGNCTSTSGGPGSLNFSLTCKTANGDMLSFVSTGSYKPGVSSELRITIGMPGSESTMHVTSQKVSDNCPK